METRDALTSLGFIEDWDAMSDLRPGYKFTSGQLELRASQVMSQYFKPIFLVTGIFANSRTVSSIQSEMPLQVESLDQAKAWIAHGADVTLPVGAVPWLEEGRTLKHLLPWEREGLLYGERPQSFVPREWMRLAITQLRAMAQQAEPDEECEVTFDGKTLVFTMPSAIVPLAASGERPWPEAYRVRLADFAALPKRLMQDPVGIHVWEAGLVIGNHRFAVL